MNTALCYIESGSSISQSCVRVAALSSGIVVKFHDSLAHFVDAIRSEDAADGVLVVAEHHVFNRLRELNVEFSTQKAVVLVTGRLERIPLEDRKGLETHLAVGVSGGNDCLELGRTLQNFSSSDFFGINYFAGTDTSFFKGVITSEQDKEQSLSKIFDQLIGDSQVESGYSVSPYVANSIITCMDELIINGIVHANPQYNSLPISLSKFVLSQKEQIEVEARCDGRFFACAVTDRFGRFSAEDFRKYLVHGIEKDGLARSCGVGLKWTLHKIEKLAINVVPGEKTEVVAVFNLSPTKKSLLRSNSIMYVSRDDDQDVFISA